MVCFLVNLDFGDYAMTPSHPTDAPTPEAMKEAAEIARAVEWHLIRGDNEENAYEGAADVIARALDAFATAAAEREREACAAIADEDAAAGRGDLDDPELDGLAGARILAAERIAFHIRRRGEQP